MLIDSSALLTIKSGGNSMLARLCKLHMTSCLDVQKHHPSVFMSTVWTWSSHKFIVLWMSVVTFIVKKQRTMIDTCALSNRPRHLCAFRTFASVRKTNFSRTKYTDIELKKVHYSQCMSPVPWWNTYCSNPAGDPRGALTWWNNVLCFGKRNGQACIRWQAECMRGCITGVWAWNTERAEAWASVHTLPTVLPRT